MQLKQRQISDNLRQLNSQSISKLTDDDIYHYLKNEIGLSIGPMVQSTRPLYEKLLNESIQHLDNIDEFLSNFTKIGDEKKSTKTALVDSGHGQSMNNSSQDLNNFQNLSTFHQEATRDTNSEQLSNRAANNSNKSNVSNKSNGSDHSDRSTQSNASNTSIKQTDGSDDQIKSNNLNANLIQGSISSPIPVIKITNPIETNFDNRWSNIISSNEDQSTRCSTPIERQSNSKRIQIAADPQIAKSFQSYNHQPNVVEPVASYLTEQREIGLAKSGPSVIPKNPLNNPFKNINLNRNVFKDYTTDSLQRNQINRPLESCRISEPTFKTASAIINNHQSIPKSLPTKPLNQQTRPVNTNMLQFSDNEDANEECGAGYEYKITTGNQTARRRLSGRIFRVPFSKSDYNKRSVPNYQTNHPPKKNSLNWLNSLLIFILALFIFSLVLALTTYL